MREYRTTTAVATVVSAFLLWLGLFLGADVAWYHPSLLIPVGRYLLELVQKNAKKRPEPDQVPKQKGVCEMPRIHVSHLVNECRRNRKKGIRRKRSRREPRAT